jgi:hypothetical protein
MKISDSSNLNKQWGLKKMDKMRFIMFFVFAFWFHTGMSQVIRVEVNNFSDINTLYQDNIVNPKTTLLVVDIDDTILTMSQPLGGVGWWDWQSDLLRHHKESSALVAKNFDDLVKIQNLLFGLIQMQVTDADVLPFLKKVTQQGASLMGLTARSSDHLNVTLRQLEKNDFFDENNQFIFKSKGLKLKNGKTSSAGDLECASFSRYVTYYQGVVFLAGEDKGQALMCILNQSEKKYTNILFVDDTLRNVDSVSKAFEKHEGVRVFAVFYTLENAKAQLFLNSPSLQNEADNQWQNINMAIRNNIALPN